MDMEQDGTSKKDAASEDLNATRKEAEETNTTVSVSAETVLVALHLHNLHSIFASSVDVLSRNI